MVTHLQAAKETVDSSVARLVSTLALVLPCLALLQVLANARDYRQPAVAAVVWLAVLGAGAWLVPRVRAGGLSRAETAAAIAIAVAAVALVDADHRARAAGGIDLAVLGAAWLLVPVVMSSSALVWLPAALLLFAVHAALLIHGAGLDPVNLSQLGAAGYIIAALLIVFTVLRPLLDARAALAARQSALASRSAAERAAAAAIEWERTARLAALEREALPLLRAIADGTLDPTDEEVRARCERHAGALRQSIDNGTGDWRAGGGADGAGPAVSGSADNATAGAAARGGTAPGGELPGGRLATGLSGLLAPALRAATARGLAVTFQQIGDPVAPPPPVGAAVLAAVDAVLSRLPPHPVLLTALRAGDDVELYLTFGAPLPDPPDLSGCGAGLPPAVRWHAEVAAADGSAEDASAEDASAEGGAGCLEVSWRDGGCR